MTKPYPLALFILAILLTILGLFMPSAGHAQSVLSLGPDTRTTTIGASTLVCADQLVLDSSAAFDGNWCGTEEAKACCQDAVCQAAPESGCTGTYYDVDCSGACVHLDLIVPSAAKGFVYIDPPGVDCPPDCPTGDREWVAPGGTVRLEAQAETGYYFAGWTGDCNCDPASYVCELTLSEAATCGAAFLPMPPPARVPTMNQWGIIILSLILAGIGCLAIRRSLPVSSGPH